MKNPTARTRGLGSDNGLRLVEVETRRVRIDRYRGFPWRGLALGLACWAIIGLLLALL